MKGFTTLPFLNENFDGTAQSFCDQSFRTAYKREFSQLIVCDCYRRRQYDTDLSTEETIKSFRRIEHRTITEAWHDAKAGEARLVAR